jgi:pilus assembly protein Flp/PilA
VDGHRVGKAERVAQPQLKMKGRKAMMFQMLIQKLAYRLNNEEGSNAIEYGLIAALVSVAIIVSLGLVATALNATFTSVAGAM